MKTTGRHFLVTAALVGGLAMTGLATSLVALAAALSLCAAPVAFAQAGSTAELGNQ